VPKRRRSLSDAFGDALVTHYFDSEKCVTDDVLALLEPLSLNGVIS
jgi:hypothetical protein